MPGLSPEQISNRAKNLGVIGQIRTTITESKITETFFGISAKDNTKTLEEIKEDKDFLSTDNLPEYFKLQWIKKLAAEAFGKIVLLGSGKLNTEQANFIHAINQACGFTLEESQAIVKECNEVFGKGVDGINAEIRNSFEQFNENFETDAKFENPIAAVIRQLLLLENIKHGVNKIEDSTKNAWFDKVTTFIQKLGIGLDVDLIKGMCGKALPLARVEYFGYLFLGSQITTKSTDPTPADALLAAIDNNELNSLKGQIEAFQPVQAQIAALN